MRRIRIEKPRLIWVSDIRITKSVARDGILEAEIITSYKAFFDFNYKSDIRK